MEEIRQYCYQLIGSPYRWGGDDTIKGFDCSGMVVELLKASGVLKEHEDYSSQGLFDRFHEDGAWNVYKFGALAFYGESVKKITHVAWLLSSDKILTASGGGSKTLTEEDAAKHNAFIKIRPIKYRSDLLAIVMPKYPGYL